MKFAITNVPIYIGYIILPLISFICGIVRGNGNVNYELVWLMLPVLLLPFANRYSIKIQIFVVIISLTILLTVKYLLPILWINNITWRAFFIDLKWIYYLLIALLWINSFGKLNIEKLYKGGRNLCIIYISYILIKTAQNGAYSRFYELMYESNYVCFLFLIPFCFIRQLNRPKKEYAIFIIATLLSGSKTGIVSLVALLIYPLYEKSRNKLIYWLLIPALLCIYIYVFFTSKGVGNLEDVDRIIFFVQFYEYLRDTNWPNILFGVYAGAPMQLSVIPAFNWYIENFENINHITGCYPFYFHSTYIRLAIVWGIPCVSVFLFWIFRLLYKTENNALKNLIILFLLQSISMSTLTLTTVSFLFFLTFLSVYLEK